MASEWDRRASTVITRLRAAGAQIAGGSPDAADTGVAELDAVLALASRIVYEGDVIELADAAEVEGVREVVVEQGHDDDKLGDLLKITDEGTGPDGYYVEVDVARDRAPVWRIGHDPFEAVCLSPSLVDWLFDLMLDETVQGYDPEGLGLDDDGVDLDDTGIDLDDTGIDLDDTVGGVDLDETDDGIDLDDTGVDLDDTGIDLDDTGVDLDDTGVDLEDTDDGIDLDDTVL